MPLFACQKNGYSILEALSERCSFLKTTVSPVWSQFFSMSFPKGIQPWLGGKGLGAWSLLHGDDTDIIGFSISGRVFFKFLWKESETLKVTYPTKMGKGKSSYNHTFCGDKFQGGYTNHHQLPTHRCPKTRDDPYAPHQFAPTRCGSPLGDLERQGHTIRNLHVKKCLGSLWKKSTSPKLSQVPGKYTASTWKFKIYRRYLETMYTWKLYSKYSEKTKETSERLVLKSLKKIWKSEKNIGFFSQPPRFLDWPNVIPTTNGSMEKTAGMATQKLTSCNMWSWWILMGPLQNLMNMNMFDRILWWKCQMLR